MGKKFLDSTVLVLNKEKSGENFIKLELFCPNEGKISSLSRISKKSPTQPFLDLFDIAEIHLSSPEQGTHFFIKDFHPILHHRNISKNYHRFYYACHWMQILSLNLIHVENLHGLFSLTQKTLNAFNLSFQAHSIYIKTLYIFLRHEGYPIKEDWLTHLPATLLNHTLSILKNPLAEQNTPVQILEALIQNLESWINEATDLLLPKIANLIYS